MNSARRIRFWVGGAVVFFALLYLLRGILPPFVAGMAVAYFLDPVADRLQRMGASRLTATVLITAGFFVLLVLLLALMVPVLEGQIGAFVNSIPGYIQSLAGRAGPLIQAVERYLSPEDVERLRGMIGNYAGAAIGWIANLMKGLLSGSLALVNLLSLLFITPVVTFYLLRDWDRMMEKVDGWLPRRSAGVIREQGREIDRTLSGFVRGQSTVCLVLAMFYGIALTAVGLDVGLIVGLGSGLISFVPYLGSITGFVVGVGLALAQSPDWALPVMVAAVFLFGQLVEGNFLTPKLVGDRVGLHPVWVIFALLAGGALFGFVGVLLGVPVAAVIGVLARFALRSYLSSPLYRNGNPGAEPRP